MPNPNDAEGLSVSQAGLSSIEVASTTTKGKRACLAEFPKRSATSRGLTIRPAPTDRDPGHALIPEMNSAALAHDATRAVVKEHASALAQASRIVWPEPSDAPL